MTVADLMREDVVTARPDTAVGALARKMQDEFVGSVVIERDGRPVGIVTDRDLALDVVADGREPDELVAEDVMTSDPATVSADAGVMDLVDELVQASVRRMPVVDDADLVGIITFDDLVVLLSAEFTKIGDVVDTEMAPY